MLTKERSKKQELLGTYICDLAETCFNNDKVIEMTDNFKTLYVDGFRHQYSQFFPLILNMEKDEKEYSVDFLLNNLNEICMYIERQNIDGSLEYLYNSVLKLYDHLNLEIARYSSYTANQEKIKDIEQRIKLSTENLNQAKIELNKSTRKMQSVQTELIAVLSIFSAIVMSFFGGMNFIGGALQGMENAPFAKSLFFIALCGFVVFNLIYLMMYLVSKITDRNIYARCKTENCTCTNPCNGLKKIYKRLPYVFWINIVLILILSVGLVLNFISLKPDFYFYLNLI